MNNFTGHLSSLIWIGEQDGAVIHDNVFKQDSVINETNLIIRGTSWQNVKIFRNTFFKQINNSGIFNCTIEMWYGHGGVEIFDNLFYGGGQTLDICNFDRGTNSLSVWVHDNLFESIFGSVYNNNISICLEDLCESVKINNNRFINVGIPVSIYIGHGPDRVANDILISYNICENIGYSGW